MCVGFGFLLMRTSIRVLVRGFDGNNIDQKLLDDCAPIIAYEGFTTENMKKKSSAAASLCTWVCSIIEYNRIYKNVKPLME